MTIKNKSQIFRFCCRCIRVSLIQDGRCFFCNGDFILKTVKCDILIRKQRNETAH